MTADGFVKRLGELLRWTGKGVELCQFVDEGQEGQFIAIRFYDNEQRIVDVTHCDTLAYIEKVVKAVR